MSLLTNLVSYWKLDESSGNALDAQGTSTLAATGSVGTAAGVVGTARTFAAASHQYLSHVDSADLSTGDIDFTFAGWFKLATIGSFPVVLRKGISGAGSREYVLYYDTGASRLTWEVDAASGGAFEILQAGTFGALSAGVWYFFTCWHDSVNNLTGIAVDAGTADTAAYSAGVLDGTGDFQMGASTDQSLYWDGSIDEVGFWKRVLTSAERTSLYNGGAGLAFSSFGGGSTYTLAAAAGSFALTGDAAGLLAGRRLAAGPGSFALTGNPAGLLAGRRLTAAAGAFILTGNAASLKKGSVLPAGAGAFTLGGNAATLTRSGQFTLAAGAGSFTLTGQSAGMIVGRKLPAGAGAFTLGGNAARLLIGHRLIAGTGSFAFTGNSANLIYASVGSHVLSAGAGAFTLGGNAATLRVSRVLSAAAGSFALAGNPATLLAGRKLAAGAGAFVLIGNAATLRFDQPSSSGHTDPGCWGGTIWGGATWGGSPAATAPPIDGDTLIEAIVNYLGGIAGVGDTVSGIYRTRPARGWSYPLLIVNQINASSEMTNRPEYMEEEEFQFSIISDDDIQASTIAWAARRALLPKGNRKLIFLDGYDMVRMPTFHGRLVEQPSRGPSNSNVWMYIFGFKFLVGRSQ